MKQQQEPIITQYTLEDIKATLRIIRPKAMDKNYNQCTMYEKGQCDVYSEFVRGFSKLVYGSANDDDSKRLRVAFVLEMLKLTETHH